MPDIELSTAPTTRSPYKRARLAHVSLGLDSDDDFLETPTFTTVQRHKNRAAQGTQDIRDALALVPAHNRTNE